MQQFPDLNADQVAIMRADSLTGHVLDENFELAIDDNQIVFTTVGSLEEAMAIVKNMKTERPNIEFVIYGMDKKVLKFVQ
jgi:hypothetical protein